MRLLALALALAIAGCVPPGDLPQPKQVPRVIIMLCGEPLYGVYLDGPDSKYSSLEGYKLTELDPSLPRVELMVPGTEFYAAYGPCEVDEEFLRVRQTNRPVGPVLGPTTTL